MKYIKLADTVKTQYPQYLQWGLGEFLLHLKEKGDLYYLHFLNKYGDKRFSCFYINNKRYTEKKDFMPT
ncbi:MAG: hypothetical protein A4E53_02268 [Pelotomaculum sp. PtaB.Bin104]|nr:MAG: hypothetical protein A4E53_02268 [Pelotomaculum sp. PtaB.Bin104]